MFQEVYLIIILFLEIIYFLFNESLPIKIILLLIFFIMDKFLLLCILNLSL